MNMCNKRITAKSLALVLLGCILGMNACKKEEYIDRISGIECDFEGIDEADDLLTGGQNWASFGISRSGNTAMVVRDTVHSADAAIRFAADGDQTRSISTSSLISNDNLFLRDQSIFSINCWIFIPSYSGNTELEILRLEDAQTEDKRSSVSFYLDADGALALDRSEMGLSDLLQPQAQKTAVPTDQWVHLDIAYLAESRSRGYVKVWQDDALVLEALSTETLPKVSFHLSDSGNNYFSRVSFGILSNASGTGAIIFWDDLRIWNWG